MGIRRYITNRFDECLLARRNRRFKRIRRHIVEPLNVKLAQVQTIVRMQVVNLNEAIVCHRIHFALGKLKRSIMHLHIACLCNGARLLLRGEHRIHLLERKADRLLNEDMFACLKRGEGHLCLRISVAEEDCIYVCLEQFGVICDVIGDVEPPRDCLRCAGRQVTDNRHLKFAMQFGKVGKVLDLRNRPTPDDSNTDTAHIFSLQQIMFCLSLYRITSVKLMQFFGKLTIKLTSCIIVETGWTQMPEFPIGSFSVNPRKETDFFRRR